MYNRYIPGANGVYERHSVHEQKTEQKQSTVNDLTSDQIICSDSQVQSNHKATISTNSKMDLGDLLLLCIILLLLVDCDQDDTLSVLITAAAFLFL